MKDKKGNQKNENNESNHPEMNEEHIEVSKEVPNNVEELLERQNIFCIEFIEIDDLDNENKIKEIIDKRQEMVDKTIKEILKILNKNNAGLNEDIALAKVLLKRIKGFHKFLLKKINLESNNQTEIIEKISKDCAKFEMILKLLENDSEID